VHAIPAAMANGAVASAGCIGNRVYTGVGDNEFYIVLRGATLARVADEIPTIESANQTLTAYHRERRSRIIDGIAWLECAAIEAHRQSNKRSKDASLRI